MTAHGEDFHGDRKSVQDSGLNFLGGTKGARGVGEKALEGPIRVVSALKCCSAHTVTRCANPRLEAPQLQKAPSAAALLCHPCPGWMWAGLPQGKGLIVGVCMPEGEFPIWQDGVGFCPGLRPWHHPLWMVLHFRHPEPERGASLLCQNHLWPNPSE